MHPVTTSVVQRPLFLCSAISRMVSIDSCFALSMKAQVLTTSTSASAASRVSWCPACWASPSITSESTRFLGQPSDTMPIFFIRRKYKDNRPTKMPHADHADITAILKGTVPAGTRASVRGCVRTRRDSKAGLSFIHVHDGSCFDPLQVVASKELANYDSEVAKLTTGCSVI